MSRPTDFPADLSPRSLSALFYRLNRFRLGNSAPMRWLYTLLLLGALLWAPSWLPGGVWISIFLLLLYGVLVGRNRSLRKRNFVHFAPAEAPAIDGKKLVPSAKIALYATGRFAVEGKEQTFSYLPGFYRRFATGERALLCLVRQRSLGRIAHWPDEEVGMWYIFFTPDVVQQVQWGRLDFGDEVWSAIAVTYEASVPARGRFKPEQMTRTTAYLACPNEADAQRVWADLISDMAEKQAQLMPGEETAGDQR